MNPSAKLRFFSCGKGDTILLQATDSPTASQAWGLIDCHLTKSSGAYYRIRDLVTDNKIPELRFVCLTHPDRDHYFGMRKLLEERFCDETSNSIRVREFWDSGVQFRLLGAIAHRLGQGSVKREIDELYRFLFRFSLIDDLQHRAMNQGSLGPTEFGDFYLLSLSPKTNRIDRFNAQTLRDILGGSDEYVSRRKEESNNLSVILAFLHRTLPVNIVLGGDASARVWDEALDAWDRLASIVRRRDSQFDAVKVSHHGAAGKAGKYLCDRLYSNYCTARNTIAILTVGPGDPNHPHKDVLDLLKKRDIPTYATCSLVRGFSPIRKGLPLPGHPTLRTVGAGPRMTSAYHCAEIEITVNDDGSLTVDPSAIRIL